MQRLILWHRLLIMIQQSKRYILGKGVIAAQERFKAEETFNPTYELVYWHWALTIAQQWRERSAFTPK